LQKVQQWIVNQETFWRAALNELDTHLNRESKETER